jgi:hypothetical protein
MSPVKKTSFVRAANAAKAREARLRQKIPQPSISPSPPPRKRVAIISPSGRPSRGARSRARAIVVSPSPPLTGTSQSRTKDKGKAVAEEPLPCQRCLRRLGEEPDLVCFRPSKGACERCRSLKKSAAECLNVRYSFSKYWLQGIDCWINRSNKVPESHVPLARMTLRMIRGRADGWKAAVNEIDRAMRRRPVRKPSKRARSPAPGVENETATDIPEGSEADQGRAKVSSYLEGLPDPSTPRTKVQPAVATPSRSNYRIVRGLMHNMSQALLDAEARIDEAHRAVATTTEAYNALAEYFLET